MEVETQAQIGKGDGGVGGQSHLDGGGRYKGEEGR